MYKIHTYSLKYFLLGIFGWQSQLTMNTNHSHTIDYIYILDLFNYILRNKLDQFFSNLIFFNHANPFDVIYEVVMSYAPSALTQLLSRVICPAVLTSWSLIM
jgi:hypothetical protein